MSEPVYQVFSPQGRLSGATLEQPEAVRDLSTAVVAQVWDMAFRGDEVFAVLEQELRPRFPGITFVSYEAFGDIHGRDEAAVIAALPQRLKDLKCTAAVVGVGA